MSFQAYLNNIPVKTGKRADDVRELAEQKGFTQNRGIKPGIKPGEMVKWLKGDFDLGHGHAIYVLLKGAKEERE